MLGSTYIGSGTSVPTWLQINLSNLDTNLAAIRALLRRAGGAPEPLLCAVIKSDAYGLGAVPIAQRLASRGVDMFAVHSPAEAHQLLNCRITQPLLILSPLRELGRTDPLYRPAVEGRLHLTVHDAQQLHQVNAMGKTFGCQIPIHLHLDTGMCRSGMNPTGPGSHALICLASNQRHTRLAGIFTHLAAADADPDFTDRQMAQLDHLLSENRLYIPSDTLIHAANTFATLRSSRYHRSMVRIGLGLLGYGHDQLTGVDPPIDPPTTDRPRLQPIMRWFGRINHVATYPKGSSVGYGCTYRLQRDSALGVIPVGYGDGYPLALSNRAVVGIQDPSGQSTITAPVIGRVSMNQIVIDLTPAPGSSAPGTLGQPANTRPPIDVGQTVELISDQPDSPCSLPNLARLAESNCYEMLCRLSPRLPRCYMHTDLAQPTTPHPARVVRSLVRCR